MKNIIGASLIFLASFSLSQAQSIDSVVVSGGTSFCTGSSLNIQTFQTGTFGSGNTFIAELSNASGGFSAGTTPLTIASGNAGSNFTVTIPNVANQSSLYRIKVKSTNPILETISALPLSINHTVSIDIASANVCSNVASLAITKFPNNGIYGGASGAIGGSFYPSLAPVGNDTIIYSIASNGCKNADTAIVNVIQNPTAPVITGNTVICTGAFNTFAITNPNPSYQYSWLNGNSTVAGNVNSLDISSAGAYSVIASNNGCTATSQSINITVSIAPLNLQIIANDTVCQSSNPILLSGIPAGGSFGTSNVSGGYFTPNVAGNYTITYSIQNQYGCNFTTSKNIVVSPKATITFNQIASVCLNAPLIDLTTLFTITGGSGAGTTTFSGTGVTGNSFNASIAGVGNHNITCTYTDALTCQSIQLGNIQVLGSTNINFSVPQNICLGTDSVVLIGAPANGIFSGIGVSNNIFRPSIAGTGNQSITYTIPATSSTCAATVSHSISVYNLSANAGTDASINCGTPTNLGATTNYQGASNISYSWSPSTALSNASVANPSCTATNTTDYIVTTSVDGCVATDTVNIAVSAALFSVQFTNQANISAPPFNVAFLNNTTNSFLYSFSWDFGDGTILNSNSSSVVHQYLANGSFNVSLTATNNLTGCSNTNLVQNAVTTSNACSHTAIINETGPIVGCLGDNVILTCNTITGAQYQWNLNGFPISGAPNPTYVATQTGTYTVTIYVNGCPQSSAPISVTFNSSPINPSITIVGNIASCGNDSINLIASSGYQTYQWKKNGTIIGTSTQSIYIKQTGYYSVSAFDANGCSATSAQQSVNTSFLAPPNLCAITIDSLTSKPVLQWEKPNDVGPIENYLLLRESSIAEVYDTIATVDNEAFSSFTDLNALVNTNVKSYKYKLAIQDTCGSTTLPSSYHKTILLQTSVGIGSQINLLWNNYEGIPILSYNIMRGHSTDSLHTIASVAASNGQFNFYTDLLQNPAETFFYRIDMLLPDGYDCIPTFKSDRAPIKYSQSNTGSNKTVLENIENNFENSQFNLFPNPSNGNINVNYNSVSNNNVIVEVTDLLGKITHRETWMLGAFEGNKTLFLNELNNGIYFVNFKQGNKIKTSKVIINK